MRKTLIKQWNKPRDEEYCVLYDKHFGGPLIKNQIILEFNDRNHEWEIVINQVG